ncbi:MAG: hypothetical protein ACRCWQ_12635 [Bacilli bacterium]
MSVKKKNTKKEDYAALGKVLVSLSGTFFVLFRMLFATIALSDSLLLLLAHGVSFLGSLYMLRKVMLLVD